jgi:hypothetical protein
MTGHFGGVTVILTAMTGVLGRLRRQWPAWAAVATYGVVAALTFTDYGITWDERYQAEYGRMVIDYVASGFRDTSWNSFLNLAYYGPLFEIWPALAYRMLGRWQFEIRHAFIAASALTGLIGVALIGERLRTGRFLPFIAVLGLITIPAYYGHTFFNSKDIPFAAAFTWAIYALIRLPDAPAAAVRYGLLTAVALLIRVNAVVLFILAATAMAVMAVINRDWRRHLPDVTGRFALGAVIAWAVMILFWPWAHLDPLRNPFEALGAMVRFQPMVPVLFDGVYFSSREVPRHYLTTMLAITTPLPLVTLVFIGAGVTAVRLLWRRITFAELVVLLWLIAPLAAQALLRSPTYDGTRHYLFVYPAMALVAALGATTLLAALRHSPIIGAGILATLLAVVPHMIALHPYQYVFYNALAGGTARAAERYESDYWGASLSESARWIDANRCPGRVTTVVCATDDYGGTAVSEVLGEGVRIHFMINRRNTPPPPAFDYYICARRNRWEQRYPGLPLAHAVERMGTTLGVVRGGCPP